MKSSLYRYVVLFRNTCKSTKNPRHGKGIKEKSGTFTIHHLCFHASIQSHSTVIMKPLSRELLQNVYLCSSKHNGFRILESVEERSSSVHRQEIKRRLITYSKRRHYIYSVTEPEWISVLLGRHLPCKSAISGLLYRIVTGLNRPFLQMCWCPALMELPADTGRADGPHHAIYCREGSQLAAGEELCRQNLFHQGITFPKTMQNGLFKRDCTGGSCCLSFIGQHSINISAGNGDNLWIRQTVIPSQQAYTLYAAANYAFNWKPGINL